MCAASYGFRVPAIVPVSESCSGDISKLVLGSPNSSVLVSVGCTGKRKRTEFVKLANFESSNLLSDIRLLEDIGRETDAAVRREPPRHPRYMPINLKSLQKEVSVYPNSTLEGSFP